MAISYDTLGGSITVEPTGSVGAGNLNTNVAIVGGYDQSNADPDVTAGETFVVNSSTDAETLFGSASELAYQTDLAIGNRAGRVHAVPLPETETTETFTSTSSDTLSNTPISDPRVTTSDVTVTDTVASADLTVEIVDGTPTQPSDSDTFRLNHRTGEWAADSSSDYDITYSYADYTTAISEAVARTVRYVIVCTESDSVITTLRNELQTQAADFRFKRGVVGANPAIASADISSYTPATDDWRIIETAPARGTDDDSNTVRTCGAVGGLLSTQPVDVTGSITYDTVDGLESLATTYTPQNAADFERVTALTDEYEVAEGVTTATENAFTDIYKAEIIDYTVEQLHERIKAYRGGSNAEDARKKFRSRLKRTLASLSAGNARPPLLADGGGGTPYTLTVALGNSDTEADVDIGIDPAPITKTVTLDVSVGPVRFNGVSV